MKSLSGQPRVLIFSLRNVFSKALFRCPFYEFEDLICEMDLLNSWRQRSTLLVCVLHLLQGWLTTPPLC